MAETLIGPVRPQKETMQTPKEKCEAKGGRWTGTTCILPREEETKGKKYPTPVPRPVSGPTPEAIEKMTPENREKVIADIKRRQAMVAEKEEFGMRKAITPEQVAQGQLLEEERARLVEEEVPELVELNPPMTTQEQIPIWGTFVKAGRGIGVKIKEAVGIDPSTPLDDEQMNKLALSQIQKNEIEKGLTWSESIGQMFEGLPFGGKLSGLLNVETPRGNLEEVHTDIKTMRRRITNIETNVKMGYLPVSVAQGQIDDIGSYIDVQEARLMLLIQNSPSLNFNSDRVNGFETDILIVREKLFQAKMNVLIGAEQDPDALDLFLKTQEQDTPEWATEEW